MRLRNARACAELCRRTQRCKVSRSVSLSSMTAVGRPRADMAPPMLAHIGERSRMEKIPGSAIFRGQSAGRDTRCPRYAGHAFRESVGAGAGDAYPSNDPAYRLRLESSSWGWVGLAVLAASMYGAHHWVKKNVDDLGR